jgi:glycosyltransferase involved in cell wall biosynthesis
VRADPRLRLAMLGEVAWARSVSTVQERETYRRCRVVLVNYESVRRILDEAYAGLEIRRVTYSPGTAFEPPAPDPGPPAVPGDPDAPLILSISRHDGRKGLDVLLHALARLRDRGIAFRACLTSSGGLLEAHRELAAQLGLGERVSFPGRVASQLDYLRHCDIFALPSREEGSGSVSVLEALQAGAAIVSSDVDGMPEDLTHEHDALLVPPGDADALADALARLLADPQLRERLGAAGRVTYEERFTPERTARDLAAIYTELGLRPAS